MWRILIPFETVKRQLYSWRFCLVLFLLLLAQSVQAQVPQALVGRWALQQISFEARRPLPDSLQQKLFYSPAGETNSAVKEGTLTVQIEFRADGTYRYEMIREKQPFYTEQGRYQVKNGVLTSYSADTDHSAPTLDTQAITKLTRKVLQVEIPIWKPEQRVFQQIRYVRLANR
ncbi:hypothetical protein HMJ29_13940 [Hymenobacter taeanensis]|uniref:Lipocalin-like domain-containing protein n=1 Tax=Hymenobacter taeanensis TaxID=2735321 RepID=A0A6M6BIZ9_9BACT|nr:MULTISPECIES: hypothetical protein [Hymenobacter]QJX47979.1 hypothetical protein HMJ29_13940 [Hymenobacter taeanensis]UOQ82573.1 hypothetical protein MUN83_07360 [Hymenobacter sp. 5414T-23]